LVEVASLEACTGAVVPWGVAHCVEEQAKQAARASASEEGIVQQVLVAVAECVESVLELCHCHRAVALVDRHLPVLGSVDHLQTLCVAYSSEILGCLLPAIALLVYHGALPLCLSYKHKRQ